MRRILGWVLLVLPLAVGGCSRDAEDKPGIMQRYGPGFFDEEQNKEATWRWMGPEGVVKLRNTRRAMTLKLVVRAPLEAVAPPPTIRLLFNGEPLDQFTPPTGTFEKEYQVPQARQSSEQWSELRLLTNKTFVPKEVDSNANDGRHLGLQVFELVWAPL